MTFAEYFLLMRRHWRAWVVCVLAGLLGAFGYNSLAPVKYTAVTTSFVAVAESASATSGDVFQGSQFAIQRVKSYAPLGTSPQVLQPVIDRLGLGLTVAQLKAQVEVSSPEETVLLEVSATNRDPRTAVRIADAVSDELATRITDLETPRLRGTPLVNVTVTQPAQLPVSPSSPRTMLDLIIGGLAGAALGLAVALMRHHFRRRIEGPEDVQALTGVPPLGLTPPLRGRKPEQLVTLDRRSVAAEQYRTIRTALTLGADESRARQLVISSPSRRDGKTTVAANLAISWAQAGHSVCLVDADLRDPAAAGLLGVDTETGLSDMLIGAASLEEVLQATEVPRLSVLPAGRLPSDPPGLLGGNRMAVLARILQARFDVVIYDTPAMGAVADALVLSEMVGGLIMVARSGATSRAQLGACLERAEEVELLGVVATAVRQRGKINTDYSAKPGRRAEAPLLDVAEVVSDATATARRRIGQATRGTTLLPVLLAGPDQPPPSSSSGRTTP